MAIVKIETDVYSVGSIDWDRRLFDELIPLPDGTSYNSYLIRGEEKTALIDTVDPTKADELVENLKKLKVNKLDYVVSNHAEQDHSGAIPEILRVYPEAKVLTNKKCKAMLSDLLMISEEKFVVVNDGDSISLGGKTLSFLLAPWVHWPETMFTYLKEEKILFTCDFLGSHLATSDIFVTGETEAEVYRAAKRYYAEIMMPFRKSIQKNIEKIKDLNVEIIAPSHGPIYKNPGFILDAYKNWISDDVKNRVVVPYVSMHKSTRKMVDYFVNALMNRGISVEPFNLTRTDVGELAMSLVDTATIVVASPTVLAGPHPAVVYAVYLVNALRPKIKFASVIGSYGWGGRMVDIIKENLSNLKVEIIEPVVIKGYPGGESFKSLDKLADTILEKHREEGIAK